MKKILVALICIILPLTSVTVVNASNEHAVNQNISEEVFETFKKNMDIIFTETSDYRIYNMNGDVTDLFKDDNQYNYDNKNYKEMQDNFANNNLYILGDKKIEKGTFSYRSSVSVTYKRSDYYYTIMNNGLARGEFGAYVYCNAACDDRTGKVTSSGNPYFGRVQVHPGSYYKVSVDSESFVRGNWVDFKLKSFQVTASDSSGFVVGVVNYNRVYCNIEDSFQPVTLL